MLRQAIAAANEIFAPDPTGSEKAKKIIAAHAEAEKAGKGVVLMDGQLIENLHVEDAHRLLALAKAIAEMEAA